MKKLIIYTIGLCVLMSGTLYAQKKLAQTGFQFLSVGVDSRAAAMGEAYTTVEGVSSAIFHNPAGMARLNSTFDFSANHTNWIADINYNAISAAVNPAEGRYGVLGLTATWVDYGEFLGTMVWRNSQEYVDTGTLHPQALALGVGYAKYITDRFAVGGVIRSVTQSLGNSILVDQTSATGLRVKKYAKSTLSYDFGTIFRTGFKSLSFGMSVRNFSREVKFIEEAFQLPLTFRMGISMNVLDFVNSGATNNNALWVSVDAAHPRSHPEYINMGVEYRFMNKLMARAGYLTNQDERGLTYGLGVQLFGVGIDYAYTPFGVFNNVQHVTIRFSL